MTKKRLNNKSLIGLLTLVTLLFAFAVNVSAKGFSCFWGTAETKANYFDLSKSPGPRIVEPNWDPVKAKDIKPGQKVVKDPKIRNIDSYESFAVIKVEMPTVSAKMKGDTKEKVYDQFVPDINTEDYVLLYERRSTVAGVDSVYYYGLKKILQPDEYSHYLFKTITEPRFIYIGASEGSIKVSGAVVGVINPVTKTRFTDVKQAFSLMGDYTPDDYDTYAVK